MEKDKDKTKDFEKNFEFEVASVVKKLKTLENEHIRNKTRLEAYIEEKEKIIKTIKDLKIDPKELSTKVEDLRNELTAKLFEARTLIEEYETKYGNIV